GPAHRVIDVGKGADSNTDYDLRIQGSISGSAGFVKKGPGILRFNGASVPLTGTIEVQAGTFNPSTNNNLVGLPDLLLTGGDLLMQSGNSQTFNSITVNKGNITGGNSTTTTAVVGKVELRVTANATRVIKVPVRSVSGTGKIDLKHNHLITASAIGSATGGVYNGVSGLIQSGRGGGGGGAPFWDGTTGIVTTMPDATSGNFTSIGVATAQQVKSLASASDTAVWSGQTVTGSNTLVMYTYGGDANLDGKINVDDYGKIDFAVGLPGPAGWYHGDFIYGGEVKRDD